MTELERERGAIAATAGNVTSRFWLVAVWSPPGARADLIVPRPTTATKWVDLATGAQFQLIEGTDHPDLEARVLSETHGAPRRWSGVQINPGALPFTSSADGVVLVFREPYPAYAEEFNDWYDMEHLPRLRAVPGVLSARRYVATAASAGYLAIYHVSDPVVTESDEWNSAARSPWGKRIAKKAVVERSPMVVGRRVDA